MGISAQNSRAAGVSILFLAVTLVSLHAQAPPAEATNWRAKLPELQLSTRQIANLHNLIKRSQTADFRSISMETGSAALLQSHCLYEEAVQDMLGGDETGARQKVDQAIALVLSLPDEDKPALRRLVLAQEALSAPGSPTDLQARIVALANTVQQNSLPSTEVMLKFQYEAELWLTSAELLLQAFTALEAAPRQPRALAEIVEKAGTEICGERTLVAALTAEADHSLTQHEVLLDQLVFQKRQEALFEKLFAALTARVKALPNALQPSAFALLTLWFGQSPEGLSPVPINETLLSPEEMNDYFSALDSLLSLTENTGLSAIREKMVLSVPEAVLDRCPANRAGLHLADALIDAGQVSLATEVAQSIATRNPELAPDVAVLEIKGKVKASQWTAAVQKAESALQAHGRETMPTDAFYWTAQAQIKTDQTSEAIRNFKEFVTRSPGSRLAPTAALMAGLLHLNLKKTDEAKADLEFTVKTYPNSPAAEKARKFLAISARQGEPVLRDPKDTR